MKYFDIINKRLDLFIQHARTGGEHKIRVHGRGWKCDGYIEEYDTVIEYMGCYFHGCPDCVPNREKLIYGETAQKRYDDTQFRLSKIREKYANVIVVWGHEFAEMLEDEETLEDHLLDIKILLGLPIDLPPIKRQQQITDYFGDTQTPPKDLPDEPERKVSTEPKRRRLSPDDLESA
jgi:G:T-mismatch repair DNA endonuclease (very short patch repair protein)